MKVCRALSRRFGMEKALLHQFVFGLVVGLGVSTLATSQQLDVLAYDFYRKFNHYVHIGECADVARPSSTPGVSDTVRCHLKKDGVDSYQPSKIIHETVVEVKSSEDIFSQLGICDGDSASRLGLLHNSECITVEIAKTLSIDEKVYTRALFGTYRTGMVILGMDKGQPGSNPSTGNVGPKFFVKYITYGSKEMIMVALSYKTAAEAKSAKKIELMSGKLSVQLETIFQKSKGIEDIKITRLSTADREHRSWSFPSALVPSAIEQLKQEETELDEVKFRVLSETAMDPYYMNYVIWPFTGNTPGRAKQKDMLWQNVTLCEINLSRIIRRAKAVMDEKCVGVVISSRYCKRLSRRMTRTKRLVERDVHFPRATWFNQTAEAKTKHSAKCYKLQNLLERKLDRTVHKLLYEISPEGLLSKSRSTHRGRLRQSKARKGRPHGKRRGDKRRRKNKKDRRRKTRN